VGSLYRWGGVDEGADGDAGGGAHIGAGNDTNVHNYCRREEVEERGKRREEKRRRRLPPPRVLSF
jgi:hypothetical protein